MGSENEHEKKEVAEESMAVQATQSLYKHSIREQCVIMLWDWPGMGKAMAGASVSKDFHLFLEGDNALQGLMVSTKASTGLFVKILAVLLDAL